MLIDETTKPIRATLSEIPQHQGFRLNGFFYRIAAPPIGSDRGLLIPAVRLDDFSLEWLDPWFEVELVTVGIHVKNWFPAGGAA